MSLESITDLTIFTRVAAAGSLSAAGRELDLSPAVVSKRLARLEEGLGTRLFHRTTRRLRLTEEGAGFYERCVRILADLEEAEAAVTQRVFAPRGTLKVAVPAAFGRLHIAPAIAGFFVKYPDVRINLTASNRVTDMVEEGYDLLVSIANLKDSSLIARRLAPNTQVICASPAYLSQHGIPRTPDDLKQHNCLVLTGQDHWHFEGPAGEEVVKVEGNLETNNGEVLRECALGGVGLAQKSTWDVGRYLQSGALQPVLTDYSVISDRGIYALYPSNRHLSSKVRAFVDYLAERFGPHPYWEMGLEWVRQVSEGQSAAD